MESFLGHIVKESKVQNRVYSTLALCNKEGEIRTHTHNLVFQSCVPSRNAKLETNGSGYISRRVRIEEGRNVGTRIP